MERELEKRWRVVKRDKGGRKRQCFGVCSLACDSARRIGKDNNEEDEDVYTPRLIGRLDWSIETGVHEFATLNLISDPAYLISPSSIK